MLLMLTTICWFFCCVFFLLSLILKCFTRSHLRATALCFMHLFCCTVFIKKRQQLHQQQMAFHVFGCYNVNIVTYWRKWSTKHVCMVETAQRLFCPKIILFWQQLQKKCSCWHKLHTHQWSSAWLRLEVQGSLFHALSNLFSVTLTNTACFIFVAELFTFCGQSTAPCAWLCAIRYAKECAWAPDRFIWLRHRGEFCHYFIIGDFTVLIMWQYNLIAKLPPKMHNSQGSS